MDWFIIGCFLGIIINFHMFHRYFFSPIGVLLLLTIILLFTAPFSALFIVLHRQKIKMMGYKPSHETIAIHQTRNIVLNLPYDKAFELCLNSLKTIKKYRIKKVDQHHGIIGARKGLKWYNYDETISFKIWKINSNRTHIKISTRPLIPFLIFDYSGSNFDNVEKIRFFIKAQAN